MMQVYMGSWEEKYFKFKYQMSSDKNKHSDAIF